ncbi:MAG: chemotaxis protein CheV [Candidatus Kapabacteria bacterium]|nr:chemotaxis protein CheV [Candidatus Kapabacteria bacterium]
MKTSILLESGTNELEVIEFLLTFRRDDGTERTQEYGINVSKVREIVKMPELTTVPNMPDSIVGVFTMRNQVITAIDLCRYLYKQPGDYSNSTMIVSEFNGMKFGFIVSAVTRIYRFSWQQVESPEIMNKFAGENSTVVGIVKLPEKNILLVDVEKIVADMQPELGMDTISEKHHGLLSGKNAFVAEDSVTIRNMIVTQLQAAGCTVRGFSDGKLLANAIDELTVKNDASLLPDFVITDIEMPQMDGYTVTRKIKEHPFTSDIPVALFSSLINNDVIHKGKAVGADIQLTKPQLSNLVQMLHNHLQTVAVA